MLLSGIRVPRRGLAGHEQEEDMPKPRRTQTERRKEQDFMIALVSKYGLDEEVVCREYAQAQQRGEIQRAYNLRMNSEHYAGSLWREGIRKGWLASQLSPNA